MSITCIGLKGFKPSDIQPILARAAWVLDLRWSAPRPPYFTTKSLRALCNELGVHFVALREFGNPPFIRALYKTDPDGMCRAYKDYITHLLKRNNSARNTFHAIRNKAAHASVVFLCACPQLRVDRGHCHTIWLKELIASDQRY